MKRPLTIVVLFMINSGIISGQISKFWYFGDHAALEFSNGNPMPKNNSNMLSYDGSTVLTDCKGKLIAYSNGEEIYDANGNIPLNGTGFMGSKDCMHPGVLVQVPEIDSLFYLISCDNIGGPNGLRYSSFSFFNNKITVLNKNLLLSLNMTEKLVLVRHSNNKDIWIISHELGNANFTLYLLTKLGLSFHSKQTIGRTHSTGIPYGDGGQGQISSNLSGTRIALAAYSDGIVEVFNFDRTLGILSDPITIGPLFRPWGVEFSPNGRFLYVTEWTSQKLMQYDLSSYKFIDINNSKKTVGNVSSTHPLYTIGTLSLGPNGKIYASIWNEPYIGVINSPDNIGTSCNFNEFGVDLNGYNSKAGLPYFIKPFVRDTLVDKNRIDTILCEGNTLVLSTTLPNPVWSTGDTSRVIVLNVEGKYTVSSENDCYLYIDTVNLVYLKKSIDYLGPDTIICDTDSFIISSSLDETIWSTGYIGRNLVVRKSDYYWAKYFNGCDTLFDSIKVDFVKKPELLTKKKIVLCSGESDTLRTTEVVLWSNGSMSNQIIIDNPGIYWAKLTTLCGEIIDSVEVIMIDRLVKPSPLNDTSFCEKDLIEFEIYIKSALWNNGSFDSVRITRPGVYSYIIVNECEMLSDSFEVRIDSIPLKLSKRYTACEGDSIILNSGIDNSIWNTGHIGSHLVVKDSGTYSYLVENACGQFSYSTDVHFIKSFDNINPLGSDTILCDIDSLILLSAIGQAVWNNGHHGSSIVVKESNYYWATIYSNCDTINDTIRVDFIEKPNLITTKNILLCSGQLDTILFSVEALWSDGSIGTQLIVDKPGIYWAKVSTPCGDVVDSVEVKLIEKLEQPPALVDTVLCSDRPVDYSIQVKEAVWNTGEFETLQLKAPGYYYYTITNECEQLRDSFRLSLDSIPLPLPEHITACKGETIVLYSGNPRSQWNTGPTGNRLLVQQSGRYSYSLDNACGSFFYSTDIDFIDDGSDQYLPNVFSPNGDQINDLFPGRNFSSDYSIKIYDRWGELVFEGLNANWDGYFNSKPMPPGAYVYLIELETCLRPVLKSGTVTLLR